MTYRVVKIGRSGRFTVRSDDPAGWPNCPDDFDTPDECLAWLKGWQFRDGEGRSESSEPQEPRMYEERIVVRLWWALIIAGGIAGALLGLLIAGWVS